MKIYQPKLKDEEWGDLLFSFQGYTDKEHCKRDFPNHEIKEYHISDIENPNLIIPDGDQWVKTDTNQWGRMISPNVFEFKELNVAWVDGNFIAPLDEKDWWKHETIDVTEYTDEEIQSYVSAYGYDYLPLSKSLVQNGIELKDQHAAWIIAECIFETENF